MTTTYQPKTYTAAERAALDAEWKALVAAYRKDGALPPGVAQMGTVFGMGVAGDARPEIPIIAEVDGLPRTAVLEQLPPAVRYAVDMTLIAVGEQQLPARRARGVQVIAAPKGGVAEFGANQITAFDPFNPAHANLIVLAPQQGG